MKAPRLPRVPPAPIKPPIPSLPGPPPGPFRPGFWRSPLRGPWLTSVLGSILLVLIAVVAVTGLISHSAYQPDVVRGYNATVGPRRRHRPADLAARREPRRGRTRSARARTSRSA